MISRYGNEFVEWFDNLDLYFIYVRWGIFSVIESFEIVGLGNSVWGVRLLKNLV